MEKNPATKLILNKNKSIYRIVFKAHYLVRVALLRNIVEPKRGHKITCGN